jgi:hypothetical protein
MVRGKYFGSMTLVSALFLAACINPAQSGVQVIVGGKLEPGPGMKPIEYSVVVIENGKFKAVGPEASTPVPIGAEMTRGNGMTIEPLPGGPSIEAGNAANLLLKADNGGQQRTMREGKWVP